jgi:hypothetical protein
MRVQHVWAKTGTSPVAFHNTTRDVALCPASEHRPGRVFAEIKGRKCGHIERTRATVAPPHSPDGWAALLPGPPRSPGSPGSLGSLGLSGRSSSRRSRPRAAGTAGVKTNGGPGRLGGSQDRAGGRGLVGWAEARTVCRCGRRHSSAGLIVSRWGQYTTRTAHNDPYVRSWLLRVVGVRISFRCRALGHRVVHALNQGASARPCDDSPNP